MRFLVETGAELSVIPPSRAERQHRQDNLTLQAANNKSIATYRKHSLTLDFGLRRTFRWVFVITDVKSQSWVPIFYDTMVCWWMSGTDALTHLQVQGVASSESSPRPSLLPKTTNNTYEAILSEFPTVTQPSDQQPIKLTTSLPLVHHQYMPALDSFPLNVCSLLVKSLNICCNWPVPRPVVGHFHYTWFPLVTGVLVVIIALSTISLYQIVTRSRTFRTLYMEKPYSLSWILLRAYHQIPVTFSRLRLQLPLIFSSL